MFPTRFSLAEILVLAGGAIAIRRCQPVTRISARCSGTQLAREACASITAQYMDALREWGSSDPRTISLKLDLRKIIAKQLGVSVDMV